MANTKNKNKTLDIIKKAVKSRSPKSEETVKVVADETVEIPGLFQPSEYDLNDELVRMDSFSYRQYNE